MLTKEKLKNTFIKYTPEITEEIFNRIIKKLEDLGFKESMSGNKFKDFCEKNKFISILHQEIWFIHNGSTPSKEIQVSYILGEDWNKSEDKVCETCNGEGEVMTAKLYPSGHTEVTEECSDCNGEGVIYDEEFVLPEKWCIRWTSEEIYKSVNKYFNGLWDYYYGSVVGYDKEYFSNPKSIPENYTEITFEQFKKHVLKEEGGEMKEQSMKEKLEGKYLYFKPEWSFELFEKVYNKLASEGIKNCHPIKEAWNYCNGQNYRYWNLNNNKGFNPKMQTPLVEIEDILGKDWGNKKPSPKKLTDKELLEEAKRRYSIGCIIDSLGGFTNVKVKSIEYTGSSIRTITCNNNEGILYNKKENKWAKIVSTPRENSIKKWSVGSYVVAIVEGHARSKPQDKYSPGFITKITTNFKDSTFGAEFSSNICNKSDFEWFATKEEAEAFAKTLREPVKDTTPKFEVGKWYKNLGNSGYIAKADKKSSIKNNNEFWHGEYITDDGRYVKGGGSWLEWSKNTIECPLEEIQQYLPDGHPDKLTEEYKIGDWIILTEDYSSVKKGTIHRIDGQINPILYTYVSISSSVGYGCLPFKYMIRKATPEEISKAKGENTMEKFQKGKWYVYIPHGTTTLICYQENNKGYGFWKGVWGENKSISDNNWRKASGKEVEERLLTYAKEKYPVGTEFINIATNRNKEIVQTLKWHTDKNIGIYSTPYNDNGAKYVYYKGKWAEITSKPEPTLGTGVVSAWELDESSSKEPLEWKVGAYVRYKGTKKHDGLWEEYFGTKGVVKGDVGVIQTVMGNSKWYFIKDNIRTDNAGILLKEDLELITKEEYERGLRKDTAPWKVPTVQDLTEVKNYLKEEIKTDKVEVQLIDVPRI